MENYITKKYDKGNVNISEEVVFEIIKNAVSEVDGVGGISTTAGAEIAGLVGLKSFSKGIKISCTDEAVCVEVIITVNYGCNIVNIASKVQDSIYLAVQSMTGVDNLTVNVHVSGINFN